MSLVIADRLIPEGAAPSINYNYSDVSAGTGYVTYYAGKVFNSYALSNQTFNSTSLNTNALINQTSFTKFIDNDFDVHFNMPQIIRGRALISVPVAFYHVGNSASPTANMFILTKIRKVKNGVESEIAAASSAIWTAGVATANLFNYNVLTSRVEVPFTQFGVEEDLRVTIEAWAKEGEANNNQVIIYHDPTGRTSNDGETFNQPLASGASILKVQIPFKIEV